MSVFRSKGIDVAIPIKPFLQRMLIAALVACSVLLLFMERTENGVSTILRMALTDALVPVVEIVSAPVQTVRGLATATEDMFFVYSENKRLRDENARLMQWQQAAHALEVENSALRGLMRYHPQHATAYISARVVGQMHGPFANQVVISAGSEQGVKPYQAVINEFGLVGRVSTVGKNSSRVLLLTDMNSRIPVMAQSSGLKSVLAGDQSELPHLRFAYGKQNPELGEAVITTGDGDVFPSGLMVGKVFAESDGHWRVRPLVDFSTLHFVRVVDFSERVGSENDSDH